MTIWRVGMNACCIDARPIRGDIEMPLIKGGVYTVVDISHGVCPIFGAGTGLHFAEIESETEGGWLSDRFRPVVEDKDDAGLIARIKSCKRKAAHADA